MHSVCDDGQMNCARHMPACSCSVHTLMLQKAKSDALIMFQIIKNDELQEPSSETFVTVYLGKLRGSNVAIKRNGICFPGKPSQRDKMHVNALLRGVN
ncbi:unnamed protein product [Triticum turgidum subsp. durum]|uniref:Uncharacterized protein n=1 Tax=Triticum turgidum subsp. durum TaxID=4567 RepID=A0A9R0QJV0_TRITD|nr:unnamed protein product [Triticum turgidum subsp. durum]